METPKSAAKISRGRRIRNPLRTQGIHIDFAISQSLDVFQARAAHHHVIRYVQYVIRFMIRQVNFQNSKSSVNAVLQSRRQHHLMYRTYTAGFEPPRFLRHFVVDIARRQHGRVTLPPRTVSQPPCNSSLAISQFSGSILTHSKCPLCWSNARFNNSRYTLQKGLSGVFPDIS